MPPRRVPPVDDSLRSEYEHLAARVSDQRDRAARLRELAERLEADADRDAAVLGELASLAGVRDQLHLASLDGRLRGQRLEELAIEVLAREHGLGRPIHYREWYELVRQSGFVVSGKDPVASFLSQLRRSSRVRSAGPSRSGLYAVAAA